MGTSAVAAAWRVAPDHLVAIKPDGLGQVGTPVVVRRLRVDGVDHLGDLPFQVALHHGALDDRVPSLLEPALPEGRTERGQVAAALTRFNGRGIGGRAAA